MPVYEVTRRAPEDNNSLAAFEGVGTLELGKQFQTSPLKTQATQTKLNSIAVEKEDDGPGFWSQTADFFNSDSFQGLLSTGLNVWQTREAQQAAERQAQLADQRARTEQMLAMESIRGSQQERELQARLVELQAQQAQAQAQMQRAVQPAAAAAGGGGMPGWVIPAAIGGAGLVLVLVLMKSKKSA